MTARRCVSFRNKEGLRLHGILHEPSPSTALGVCVLLLSPGIKGRTGPHRLYLKCANPLASLGFHVLRFDYYGLGDSEGRLPEVPLADVYNCIHGGRYVDDTISAMDWMQEVFGIRRFIGSGLCGGSISALLTAEADSRIESLLAIGLPTVLDGGPENWSRYISRHQASALRSGYLRKLSSPKALLRFVSGKSSYRAIFRVFGHLLPGRVPTTAADNARRGSTEIDNRNPRFAPAFLTMLESARPMLLIFSENDRLHLQFAEGFERQYASRLGANAQHYEVHVITGANHVLSDAESVRELLDVGTRWLKALYVSSQPDVNCSAP